MKVQIFPVQTLNGIMPALGFSHQQSCDLMFMEQPTELKHITQWWKGKQL